MKTQHYVCVKNQVLSFSEYDNVREYLKFGSSMELEVINPACLAMLGR